MALTDAQKKDLDAKAATIRADDNNKTTSAALQSSDVYKTATPEERQYLAEKLGVAKGVSIADKFNSRVTADFNPSKTDTSKTDTSKTDTPNASMYRLRPDESLLPTLTNDQRHDINYATLYAAQDPKYKDLSAKDKYDRIAGEYQKITGSPMPTAVSNFVLSDKTMFGEPNKDLVNEVKKQNTLAELGVFNDQWGVNNAGFASPYSAWLSGNDISKMTPEQYAQWSVGGSDTVPKYSTPYINQMVAAYKNNPNYDKPSDADIEAYRKSLEKDARNLPLAAQAAIQKYNYAYDAFNKLQSGELPENYKDLNPNEVSAKPEKGFAYISPQAVIDAVNSGKLSTDDLGKVTIYNPTTQTYSYLNHPATPPLQFSNEDKPSLSVSGNPKLQVPGGDATPPTPAPEPTPAPKPAPEPTPTKDDTYEKDYLAKIADALSGKNSNFGTGNNTFGTGAGYAGDGTGRNAAPTIGFDKDTLNSIMQGWFNPYSGHATGNAAVDNQIMFENALAKAPDTGIARLIGNTNRISEENTTAAQTAKASKADDGIAKLTQRTNAIADAAYNKPTQRPPSMLDKPESIATTPYGVNTQAPQVQQVTQPMDNNFYNVGTYNSSQNQVFDRKGQRVPTQQMTPEQYQAMQAQQAQVDQQRLDEQRANDPQAARANVLAYAQQLIATGDPIKQAQAAEIINQLNAQQRAVNYQVQSYAPQAGTGIATLQQPVTAQPVAQQPVAQQPVTQQPVLGQPVTQQPVAQQLTPAQTLANELAQKAVANRRDAEGNIRPEYREFDGSNPTTFNPNGPFAALSQTVKPKSSVVSPNTTALNGIGALATQPATQRPVYNTYASYQSTQPNMGNYMPADQIAALKAQEQAALNANAAQANIQRQGMKQTVAAP